MKKHWIMAFTVLTFWVGATSLAEQGQSLRGNPDLEYLKTHLTHQKAAELASLLQLTPSQVETLRAVKAETDRTRGEFDLKIEQARNNLATMAKALRERLEKGGAMTDADKAEFTQHRHALRKLHRERGLRLALAVSDLQDLLAPEQKLVLREGYRKIQKERPMTRRPAQSRKARRTVARLLLSEEFLRNYK